MLCFRGDRRTVAHAAGQSGNTSPWRDGCCTAAVLALLLVPAADTAAQPRPPLPQPGNTEFYLPGEYIVEDGVGQDPPPRFQEPPPPADGIYFRPTWMPCQSLRSNRSLVLGHLWFGMDIMGWSTKGVHAPALLTTNPVGTDIGDAGVIGVGSTSVLFGGEHLHNELRPGGRLRIGWYLDIEQTHGIEWHYFDLDGQDIHYDAIAADGSGVLGRPFVDSGTGDNAAVLVAFPAVVDGEINIRSNLQLTSTGILYHDIFWTSPYAKIDYLVGYRHARLYDSLRVNESLIYVDDDAGFTSGDEVTRRDQFRAINQFDGADFGLRGWWSRSGKLAITGLAKVAIGAANKNVVIDGFTTIDSGGTETTTPGGVLTQPSNIGRRSEQEFAAIGEVGLGLEWLPVCQCRISLGYTWLYWSDIARAFDQIDTRVDPNQLAPNNGGGNRPAFDLQTTSFWAQGLTAGFTYEF